MKVAVVGTGSVGQTIASSLFSLGHQVMIGTRNVAKKLASKEKDHYGNPSFAEWHKLNEHHVVRINGKSSNDKQLRSQQFHMW